MGIFEVSNPPIPDEPQEGRIIQKLENKPCIRSCQPAKGQSLCFKNSIQNLSLSVFLSVLNRVGSIDHIPFHKTTKAGF